MAANKKQWFSQTGSGERGKAINFHRNKANSEKPKLKMGRKEIRKGESLSIFLC